LGKVIPVEDKASPDSPQQVGTRVWNEGESDIATKSLSSFSKIVELDDGYNENHDATFVLSTDDDDPLFGINVAPIPNQGVCEDDNTQVVSTTNPDPSVDFFYVVDVAHKPTCAHNLENQLKMSADT